ncbi:13824_t:CDS:2, partial [Entrophospora sp. SA101]
QTTAKGMGLAKPAGEKDPVELDYKTFASMSTTFSYIRYSG